MNIFSVNDIIKLPLSKYTEDKLIEDLDKLKQNGGITKKQDFDKLMKYLIKKKYRCVYSFNTPYLTKWRIIYEKVYDMYPEFTDSQIYYLFQNLLINKALLINLIKNKFIFQFKYIYIFIKRLSFYAINNTDLNNTDFELIYYIIDKFLDRTDIDPEEYNYYVEEYKKLTIFTLNSYCKEMKNIDFDKIYVKNFIVKLNLVEEFIEFYTEKLINVNDTIYNDFDYAEKNNINLEIFNRYFIGNKFHWFNIFDFIFTDFHEKFKDKLISLDIDKFTTFVAVIFNIFCIEIYQTDYDQYISFFDLYNKKFKELIENIKNIRKKININTIGNFTNIKQILEYFEINALNLDDINKNTYLIGKILFEQYYKGEYNTELLNRFIKYSFGKEMLDFLLKEKNIPFNSDTLRYAIYKNNIYVIEYLLDNKYPASDKDFLYCNSGTFLKQMCDIYKKYNILMGDDVIRKIYFKIYGYRLNNEYYINGENTEHIQKILAECDEELKKIFPFSTYHNNIDYIFYYDMAKRGELTLDVILKMHHVIGTPGMKELIELYMEFNKSDNSDNSDKKKIIKKVVKKVVKKS